MTGSELASLRHALGLTQAQFAPLLGLRPDSLARLERGERGVTKTIALLAGTIARDRGLVRTSVTE